MGKSFLVLAIREPHFDPVVIQPHLDYLADLRRQGRVQMAGGFSDKSGGAYVLLAANLNEAQALADADPLHRSGASRLTVFEWNV
ncbi:YciI family protein [Marilutibacter alkalisoli]|uniref:YCII-related domain-containing protein n=1 Tax=Marilutibacter alkalisoli TaxID=2591633 RepID=A0A514BN72_9GAMM|nr:YciI family protein [Lysobacter alkalisoli]QDH68833.1 hypothetical protein FKV23_00930 [Lysobacter alkalisoli]